MSGVINKICFSVFFWILDCGKEVYQFNMGSRKGGEEADTDQMIKFRLPNNQLLKQ